MSLLGDGFDAFILAMGDIVHFFINIILGIVGIVLSLFTNLGNLLTILNYIFSIIEFVITIILNPYLLGLFVLGSGFYYASFTAQTKKELLMKTGLYYKYVGETTAKILNAIYTIVHKIIMALVDVL